MAEILYIPEALREKLGEQGTKELVDLLNRTARSLRENLSETAAERIERRVAEAKAEIIKEIAAAESRLFWKVLGFLTGFITAQTALLILVMRALIKGTI